MSAGTPELPDRTDDMLLIDALRYRPRLPIGRLMGIEVQDIAASPNIPTDELLRCIDKARINLHNIQELGSTGA